MPLIPRAQLKVGDIILNEISIELDPTGYAGQLIAPIYCGEPTKKYRELHEVTVEVYHRALSALKPGNTSAVIDWINEPAIEAGYKNDITWHPWAIGHGGGPKFPLRAPPEEGIKLEKNMSVMVEPNIVTELELWVILWVRPV